MSTAPAEKTTEAQDLEKQQQDDTEQFRSSKSSLDQPDATQEAPKAPTNPLADPSAFPDGGSTAWMTVAASSACFFVSWGWINCIGVFQDYFMRGAGSATTQRSNANSPAKFLFASTLPPLLHGFRRWRHSSCSSPVPLLGTYSTTTGLELSFS